VALLTDNLLLWSRSQLNGEIIKAEDFALCYNIDSIIHLYEAALQKKSIKLKKYIPADIFVHADKDMLQVIIRNLLSNAVKFTKPGGNIIIAAEHEEEYYITLSVKDDGIGMNKKTADNLFTQSLTTLGTQNEKGTGLGLKLTKEFVEKNGGTIWLKSEENKGTTFCFTLPVSKKSKIKKELLIVADNN
jgi:signal transduction histidine kinase